MDTQTILETKPALTKYLQLFNDCFGRSQTRGHLATYVRGQLSDLPRKSVEPIADEAGVPPRTLQEFLSLSRWDEAMMRDRLQQRVARCHGSEQSVGLIDETSFLKKGDQTACVQRQYLGSVGKKDNGVVSVHLGYATGDFHTLLDGDLYLPQQTWHDDRDRCRAAGIPEDVVYRAKWRIALEQVQRAIGNGVRFRWLTFDEGYGGKPPFLRELDTMGQDYVAEVPKDFHVWTQAPEVLHRRHGRDGEGSGDSGGSGGSGGRGRPRRYPRLKAKSNPTVPVENVALYSPLMRRQPWVKYRVREASQGPMVCQVKHLLVYLKDEDGLPAGAGRAYHLLVGHNVLTPDDVKYFISNAGESTPVGKLLEVALSRWKIERMFEDAKMELGLDHFEVRRWCSIHRHLILSCVSHLFLAEFHQQQTGDGRGEKPLADGQSTGHSGGEARAVVDDRPPLYEGLCPTDRRDPHPHPARNAKAARSHRKRTIRRLHDLGVYLKDVKPCHASRN